MVVLLGVLMLQAQWGLFQFMVQRDLGMYLLGETRLEVREPGIAKFAVFGRKLIRGYGPYPHANNFGGAMVIGIVATILLFSPQPHRERKQVPLPVSQLAFAVFFWLGLLVSFSRSAYIGAGLALILGFLYVRRQVKHWIIPLLVSIFVFTPLFMSRSGDPADVAVSERILGYEWAVEIIKGHGLWYGSGLGNYEEVLRSFLVQSSISFEDWQIAPVHSAPLLLAAELGVLPALLLATGVGLALVLSWPREGRLGLGMLLLPIVPLALFDYYLVRQLAPVGYVLLVLMCARSWYSEEYNDSLYPNGC